MLHSFEDDKPYSFQLRIADFNKEIYDILQSRSVPNLESYEAYQSAFAASARDGTHYNTSATSADTMAPCSYPTATLSLSLNTKALEHAHLADTSPENGDIWKLLGSLSPFLKKM
jgi:hypothetical protein